MQYLFLAKIVCSREILIHLENSRLLSRKYLCFTRGGDFACHFKNFLISAKKVGALSIGGDLT